MTAGARVTASALVMPDTVTNERARWLRCGAEVIDLGARGNGAIALAKHPSARTRFVMPYQYGNG